MGKIVKIGIIGCGSISEWSHLPVLTGPDIRIPYEIELEKYNPYRANSGEAGAVPRVVAISDLNPEKLAKLGERYNIERRFTDYKQMLDEVELDVLVVSGGHDFNMEIVPQAVRRGLHVFIEKPMTGSLKKALEMKEIVEGSGIILQVGFMRRFYYAYKTAKKLISEGEIGEIEVLAGRFWRGKNDLLSNCIHILDIIQFFGGSAVEVFARASGDSAVLVMVFENGAVGNLLLANTPIWHSVHERLEIVGSSGNTLVAENGRRLYLSRHGKPQEIWEPPQVLHWITGYNLAGFAAEFRHFLHCIQSNEKPIAGIDSGVESIRLKEGVEKSLEQGRVIKLSSLI